MKIDINTDICVQLRDHTRKKKFNVNIKVKLKKNCGLYCKCSDATRSIKPILRNRENNTVINDVISVFTVCYCTEYIAKESTLWASLKHYFRPDKPNPNNYYFNTALSLHPILQIQTDLKGGETRISCTVTLTPYQNRTEFSAASADQDYHRL